MKKIILAGGSGYLGRLLARHYLAQGWNVLTLARKPFPLLPGEAWAQWDGKAVGPWRQELENADVLINLAGRSVNCRYTKKNRAEILNSRVEATRALGRALAECSKRPAVWLNLSTATIYCHALDRAQAEHDGEIGKGFSVEIAKAWEEAFFGFGALGIRQVALRSAMVFERGGVYEAYCGIVRKGLGGPSGSGEQYVSWIHGADFVGMIDFILERPEIYGVVNVASPNPVPNAEFMRELRASRGWRVGVRASECLLEIGAVFLRTETELLLKSRRVVPARLLHAGYKMKFSSVREALRDLASR